MSFAGDDQPFDLDYKPAGDDTPIKDFVRSIDKFAIVGSDVSSAQIMLKSRDGAFITQSNIINSVATTPIIRPYDEFKITVHDPYKAADAPFSRIMIVDDRLPQQSDDGRLYQLELTGREVFLKGIKVTGHFFFTTYRDMLGYIIDTYNANKGSDAPEVELNTDAVPAYAVNTFDFGWGQNCFDAILHVLKLLSLPVPAQGAGNFFESYWSEGTAGDKIRCDIAPIGELGSDEVIVEGTDVTTEFYAGTWQPAEATIVVARGKQDTGRMPRELAEYNALIEEFDNFPAWDSTTNYPTGIYVRYLDRLWQAREDIDVSNLTPDDPSNNATQWRERKFYDYVADRLGTTRAATWGYSPWTKRGQHLAATTNPTGDFNTGVTSRGIIDFNCTILDGPNYRNMVDFHVDSNITSTNITSDIPSSYRENGAILEDTRILFTGTSINGDTVDSFGKEYADALVQYRSGKWIVFRDAQHADECFVYLEGMNYAFLRAFGTSYTTLRDRFTESPHADDAWRPLVTGQFAPHFTLDNVHYPHAINQVTGLVNPRPKSATADYTDDAAIEYVYNWSIGDAQLDLFNSLEGDYGVFSDILGLLGGALSQLEGLFSGHSAYNYGWWGTVFRAPWPPNATNSQIMGSAYKPPTLDLYNLNETPDGTTGFGTSESENLSPITGIHFLFNWDMGFAGQDDLSDFIRIPGPTGNQKFRMFIYDTESNVWVHDFTYRFLGDTEQFVLPLSGFHIYRARNPIDLTFSDAIRNLLNPELKILEIFEQRKVRHIGIAWLESYDQAGRFWPHNITRTFALAVSQFGSGLYTRGTIDGFSFVTTPIAIAKYTSESEQNPNEHSEPPLFSDIHKMQDIKEFPNVYNIEQLKKIAQAELQLSLFEKNNVTVRTRASTDLVPGNPAFFHAENVVDAAETDDSNSTPNTRKMAVKKINYTVNAKDGPGGYQRYVTIKDRINL